MNNDSQIVIDPILETYSIRTILKRVGVIII